MDNVIDQYEYVGKGIVNDGVERVVRELREAEAPRELNDYELSLVRLGVCHGALSTSQAYRRLGLLKRRRWFSISF